MKRYNKIFILMFLFVLFPINAKAMLCSNEEKVKWTNLAQNITVKYDAKEKNGKVIFSITFSNISKGLIIYDKLNKEFHSYKGSELTLNNYEPNVNYKFDIYADMDHYDTDENGVKTYNNCFGMVLYTHYAIIPAYNKYSTDSLCKGIEDYTLCQKWANINLDYDEWKEKVTTYIKSLEPKEENKSQDDKRQDLLEKLVDIYASVYYIIFPIIIVGGIAYIIIYNKKHDLF